MTKEEAEKLAKSVFESARSITSEQKSVLDKIRAEIEDLRFGQPLRKLVVDECLEIIDKYKEESMVSDYTTLKNKPQIVGVSLKNTEEMISCADMLDAIGHGTTYTTDELQKIIKGLPTVNLNTERGSL